MAACAAPGPAPAPSGETSDETVTIAWWNAYQTETVQQITPQIIGDFEAMHPNIKIDYEISGGPPGGGNLTEVLLSRIAAGNPPDTVTIFDPPAQFGALGSLTEIDDQMSTAEFATADSFYEGVLNTCKWDGKTYGLPASAACSGIFMNKSKLEEKGISTARADFPQTWDELRRLSAELTVVANGEVKQGGFVPAWADTWLYPVWSSLNGSQVFDAANRQYTIDSEQNVGWIDFWASWIEEQFGNLEQLNLAGNFNSAYPPDSAYFNNLEAMHADGAWIMTDVEFPFEWEVAHFPVGPSGSASVTGFWPNWFVMPKGGPNPEEAFLFIEYFR
ncbi:MAG: extracellular solute-binding protein [Caldilineaceae bacterium]